MTGVAAFAVICALASAGVEESPELGTGGMQTGPSRDRAREPLPDTGLLYHLQWYGADYAAVAALIALRYGLLPMWEPSPALYGPRFDDADPDFTALREPVSAWTLGAPYRENTVPELWLYIGGGALAASAVGLDALRGWDGHRTHNLVLGGAEAVALTLVTTEVLKRGVGRLRPDFQDRALRYYCDPAVGRRGLSGLDCGAVDADGVYLTAKELEDGHKSFPSGHASSAFSLATYFALYVGGEMVWGERAGGWTVPVGVTTAGGLIGLASLVAATRISDGRHHVDDVVAGAALGACTSALFYFLHFDLRGRATYRGFAVSPVALGDGMAVSLAWRL